MDVVVSQYKAYDEANTCAMFLKWQGAKVRNITYPDNLDICESNNGRPGVKIQLLIEQYTEIYGFKALMKYWDEKGLWLV